jgi:hypothetical protein
MFDRGRFAEAACNQSIRRVKDTMVHLARWQRITGWCGIFSFLLIALAYFGFDADLNTDLSAAKFMERATDGDTLRTQGAFLSAGLLVWLWFAAGLRERLSWGMGWSPLRAIGWSCAIGAVVLGLVPALAQGALVASASDLGFSDQFARDTYYALGTFLAGSFALSGMWLFASGLAAVAFGGVPKWWGWPAIVGGLLTIAGAIGTSGIGLIGFAFWWAWSFVGALWLSFADEPRLMDTAKVEKMDRTTAAA